MVKKFFFAAVFAMSALAAMAQEVKEVTLVVNGDGATKDAAVQSALRYAIEQAFGTFVSANTTILNDELVKDEIATVSSGNIQTYTELGSATLPNGSVSVTLQATVSLSKLTQYARSKGSECEFAGATFGANLKLLKLRYENAQRAYDHLIEYIKMAGPDIFDRKLTLSEPKIANGVASFEGCITYDTNKNTRSFATHFVSTLLAISFSPEEAEIILGSEICGKTPFGREQGSVRIPGGWRDLEQIIYHYCIESQITTNTATDIPSRSFTGLRAWDAMYLFVQFDRLSITRKESAGSQLSAFESMAISKRSRYKSIDCNGLKFFAFQDKYQKLLPLPPTQIRFEVPVNDLPNITNFTLSPIK